MGKEIFVDGKNSLAGSCLQELGWFKLGVRGTAVR